MSLNTTDLVTLFEQRYECLQALVATSMGKRELVDTLNIPRSTLDDIIRELEQNGLVEYRNGKWNLTLLGQITFDLHSDYKDNLEDLLTTASIIEVLSPSAPIDYRFLIDAETYPSPDTVPDEVIQVFLDSVEDSTTIRFFTPIVLFGYVEEFYQNVTVHDECQLEIILPLAVLERIADIYPQLAAEIISDEQITLYYGEVPVSFSLWITDDHAGVIVYTKRGVQGILKNDTKEALSWAVQQYNQVSSSTNSQICDVDVLN